MERGVPIRSISRCIAVLQAINRRGSLSLMEIARTSKLPYPTACRIIQTLMHEGLIECEPTRKNYRATGLVHTLSQGFRNQDQLVTCARPFIVALTRKVGWPVAIVTRMGQSMMVRDTTHDLTALTSNLYPPGYTMPLLECASGQVYFAHLDDDERKDVIDAWEHCDHDAPSRSFVESEALITRIRADGFAACEHEPHTADPGNTSSISIPLRHEGRILGALTLLFFSAAMEMTEAVERYLSDLKATAGSIGEAIGSLRTAAPVPGKAPLAGGLAPMSRPVSLTA